jgi:hypothetical protein
MSQNVMCKKCRNLVRGWCKEKIDSPDPDLERDCQDFRERTNADRIRAMTDEELARWLDSAFGRCEWCNPENIGTEDCSDIDCTGCIIGWLKQPVKED